MGKLSIVGTPIGNLEDITLRAVRILGECDVVLCEDTRVTGKLLQKFEISKPMIAYHAHTTKGKAEHILSLLEEGKHLALVSDAGTPAISDPGSLLVSQVRERFKDSITIEVIPGSSAVIAALSGTGFPSSDFLFLGFLPHKKGRETLFKEIAASPRTVVFYESPHRIAKALESLSKVIPERKIAVARELTKVYEEYLVGTAGEILQMKKDWKGEIVVMVAPV
jgi:16S rRNA (cytidine1402-2'-O)-methyltransferase